MVDKYCFDKREGNKIIYIVIEEKEQTIFVKGLYYRIKKNIEKEFVEYVSEKEVEEHRRINENYLKKIKENVYR